MVGEAPLNPTPPAAAISVTAAAPLEEPEDGESPASSPAQTLTTTLALPAGTPTSTPGITVTLDVTATQTLSGTAILPAPPEVISVTTWITATWPFRDLVVAQGEALYQGAWKPDGSMFAVGTSAGAFVYDPLTLERQRVFNAGEAVYAVAFSPVDGLLALGLLNGDIHWRDAATGKFIAVFNAHLLGVRYLSFPVESQYLVSGSDDGTVALWLPAPLLASAAGDDRPLAEWRTPDRVTGVDIHPGRQLVAAGSFQAVSLWNLNTSEELQTIPGLAGWVNDLAIRPSGDLIAAIDSSSTLQLWDTASWFPTHRIPLDALQGLSALDFSPDGRQLALGGKNGQVVIWSLEVNTATVLVDSLPQPVVDLVFNPAGDILMACYQDGLVRLWSSPSE
jgi:WD40 repeat protein